MNKRDEEKARIRINKNPTLIDDDYVMYCYLKYRIFTDYYLSKDFFREFKDFFLGKKNMLDIRNYDGYQGWQYKLVRHNLLELKKAKIGITKIACDQFDDIIYGKDYDFQLDQPNF